MWYDVYVMLILKWEINMGKTNKIENIFLKYLLKFMEEEIHGADFDLMQSMNQTKSVGKKWFDANRDKIRRELKKGEG